MVKFRSQNIFVFGQVNAPGQYALSGNMSVMQALAAAGSPTAAAASYVVVSRPAGSDRRWRAKSQAAARRCASR